MICPHCGKDTDKPLRVEKAPDGDLYINGEEFFVLGIEDLTDAKYYPAYKRPARTKPPLIVYVEAK